MADYRRLPAPVQDNWDWQARGACRGTDTAVFFHPNFERGESRQARTAAAKAVCARCPVIQQCREHALTVHEVYGTWGGLDELERADILVVLRRADRVSA